LGDFFLWAPYLANLRKRFANEQWHIAVIGAKQWACIASKYLDIDEIVEFEKRRFTSDLGYRWRLLFSYSSKTVDILFYPQVSREFLSGDALGRAICAKHKISTTGNFSHLTQALDAISSRWWKEKIRVEVGNHEIENNRLIWGGVGVEFTDSPARRCLDKSALRPNKNYMAVNLGASDTKRIWMTEHFAKVATGISRRLGLRIVTMGTSSELELQDRFCRTIRDEVIQLAGRTTTSDFIDIISQAKFILSNETSATHIGAVYGIPSLSIAGGGHFKRFLPYPDAYRETHVAFEEMSCFYCNWACKHKEFDGRSSYPCIKAITVDKVLEVVSRVA
jgi:ADP-heptose:LPS heptosyltransferase